ncbi:hypothetical protein [Rubidibacter lacunae]|nr:hypothetical protein [Rubidibacter lacunae]
MPQLLLATAILAIASPLPSDATGATSYGSVGRRYATGETVNCER